MSKRRSYHYIYSVQRVILLVFFLVTTIVLSIPLVMFLLKISPDNLYPVIVGFILYLLLIIFVAGLIHVISYIPFNLASAFDPIKNDIASGKIQTIRELAEQITSFTVNFFNFSFLDVSYAWIQTDGEELMGHEDGKVVEQVLNEYGVLERSKEMEEITLAGKLNIAGHDYSLYILPIWIGERWLGYMALLSRKSIGRFFRRFLDEYEDNFLDDQILLMTRNKD